MKDQAPVTDDRDVSQTPGDLLAEADAPADASRREAMLRLGQKLAYAAPLTIGLLKFDKAVAAS